jgi:hypothetical protein
MYNRDQSILYYGSSQQIDFINFLNVAHTTFTKHLTKGTYYLGKYLFSREIVPSAKVLDLPVTELALMLEQDRVRFNINKPLNSNSQSVVLVSIKTNEYQVFYSLGSCITFLKSKGFKADQRTLVKHLDTKLSYYGYKCYTPSHPDLVCNNS